MLMVSNIQNGAKKKQIQAALAQANKIEKEELLPKEQVYKIYEEGIARFKKAKQLLRPEWFVNEPKKPAKSSNKRSRRVRK